MYLEVCCRSGGEGVGAGVEAAHIRALEDAVGEAERDAVGAVEVLEVTQLGLDDEARTVDVLSIEVVVAPRGLA